MTSNILVEPPSLEPVSLEEAKAFFRVQTDLEDGLILDLVKAAREWAEAYTGLAFLEQKWRLWLSAAPSSWQVVLPRGPLFGLSKMEVYDEQDQSEVWGVQNVIVDLTRKPGRLVLRADACWPVMKRAVNGFMIEYYAGYGNERSVVPAGIRTALLQLALHWYENRDVVAEEGSACRAPLHVEALLRPYKVFSAGGSCA